MKLSTRARFALKAMVAIARHDTGGSPAVNLNDVSEKTHVSRRYLDQLVIALKNASLVRGISGRSGGYVLTRSAADISICQIIEAAIGPINIVECALCPENCLESDFCECRWVYRTINERIVSLLSELSLDDLLARPASTGEMPTWPPLSSACPTRQSQFLSISKEDNK